MSQENNSRESGNSARILTGPLRGHTGRVRNSFAETDESGIDVPNGIRAFIVEFNGNIGKFAFWRHEIELHR